MFSRAALELSIFNPDVALSESHQSGCDIEFAAWANATDEQRNDYRDSGASVSRSAFLKAIQIEALKEALASGKLLGIGVIKGDKDITFSVISRDAFILDDTIIDWKTSSIIVSGISFANVKILKVGKLQSAAIKATDKRTGRPDHLETILAAWSTLKAEQPGFLTLSQATQNLAIQEIGARLFPLKFPGKTRLGESTIRRHRARRPDLFR